MEECPVCLESFKDKISVTIPGSNQGHQLCLRCFIHIEKKECPLCRKNFEQWLPDIKDTVKLSLIEFLREEN